MYILNNEKIKKMIKYLIMYVVIFVMAKYGISSDVSINDSIILSMVATIMFATFETYYPSVCIKI
jgi:hypothetical protein